MSPHPTLPRSRGRVGWGPWRNPGQLLPHPSPSWGGSGVGVGRWGTSVLHGTPPPHPSPTRGRELPSFAPCGQQILGGDDDDEFSVDLAFSDVRGAGDHDRVRRPGPAV